MHKMGSFQLGWFIFGAFMVTSWYLSVPCRCQMPTPAIIRGVESQGHAYPWLVSIQIRQKHSCGGVLIMHRLVVTAAHCLFSEEGDKKILNDDELSVIVGVDDLDEIIPSNRISVIYVAPHPLFQNGGDMHYDIGLLVLARSVNEKSSAGIAKHVSYDIELPPNNPGFWPNVNSSHIFATGWGHIKEEASKPAPGNRNFSPKLHMANMTLLSYKECKRRWGDGHGILSSHAICTDSTETDICQGDSGGPLVELYTDKSGQVIHKRLIGIASLTHEGCGIANRSSVFSRVNSFMPFLKRALIESLELYPDV